MDEPQLDLLLQEALAGVIGLAVIIVIVLAIRSHARNKGWNRAIAALAEQLGIERSTTDNYHDSCHGRVRGVHVSVIRWWKRMRIQISLGMDSRLVLFRRGAPPDKNFLDEPEWESQAAPAVQTGDGAFDQQFDLRGASPVLLQALQGKPEVKQLIRQVIGTMGAYIVPSGMGSDLEMFAPLTTRADDIVTRLRPMLDLARWLQAPLAPHAPGAPGAPLVGPLNRLQSLPVEHCLAELQAFLPAALTPVGPGQAFVSQEGGGIDWRGTTAGLPLRVVVDSSGGVELHVKAQHPHGELKLYWDATKIPAVGTPPAWDASEATTVFVDRGVFVHGDPQQLELQLQRLRTFAPEVRSAIADGMRRDDVSQLHWSTDGLELTVGWRLSELLDPASQLARVAQLAGWVAQQLQAVPPDPGANQPSGAAPTSRMTCRYCSTLYLLGPQSCCPNCGAPAQG